MRRDFNYNPLEVLRDPGARDAQAVRCHSPRRTLAERDGDEEDGRWLFDFGDREESESWS